MSSSRISTAPRRPSRASLAVRSRAAPFVWTTRSPATPTATVVVVVAAAVDAASAATVVAVEVVAVVSVTAVVAAVAALVVEAVVAVAVQFVLAPSSAQRARRRRSELFPASVVPSHVLWPLPFARLVLIIYGSHDRLTLSFPCRMHVLLSCNP
ncbi:hypothetical protein NUW54_g4466 [Trametes sanguinea]|uniref:Uncharacterized protein n=1 Tax=Trametes sanguinea TaxID=158606 RepID=A0ACC1PXV3_9APHY|nr:hypothetical protein NUW54_g4466 [Trametes sanguinea]